MRRPDSCRPNRRTRILVAVIEHHERTGYGMTVRQVASAVGSRSINSVHHHLSTLKAEGLLTWTAGRSGTIVPTVRVVAVAR